VVSCFRGRSIGSRIIADAPLVWQKADRGVHRVGVEPLARSLAIEGVGEADRIEDRRRLATVIADG
jgi:hypothetical protein